MVSGIAKYVWFVVNGPKTCKTADYPLCNPGIFFLFSFSDTRVHPFSSLLPRHSSHVRGPVCSAAHGGPDRLGLGVGLPLAGSQRMDSVVIPPLWGLRVLVWDLRDWNFLLAAQPTTPDRACNQGPHMRCVLRRAARQSSPPPPSDWYVTSQTSGSPRRTHTRSSLAVTAD